MQEVVAQAQLSLCFIEAEIPRLSYGQKNSGVVCRLKKDWYVYHVY